MRNIVQYFAPMETSNVEDKETFYEQLKATHERLPKREIPILMSHLNAKAGSDNTLLGHAMGKPQWQL